MQDKKVLKIAIGKVFSNIREQTGKSLNLFCNEYDIPTTTLNEIERGIKSPNLYTMLKIIKAYGISSSEFFKLVEKELPKGFLEPEN